MKKLKKVLMLSLFSLSFAGALGMFNAQKAEAKTCSGTLALQDRLFIVLVMH